MNETKSILILGVDPGLTGALVVVQVNFGDSFEVLDYLRTPVIKTDTKSKIDCLQVKSFIEKWFPYGGEAALEKVHAMPGQGVTSMFGFGRATGAIEACLICSGMTVTEITPQAWKKRFGLLKTQKDESRLKALTLLTDCKALQKKASGQAVADAFFIGASHFYSGGFA